MCYSGRNQTTSVDVRCSPTDAAGSRSNEIPQGTMGNNPTPVRGRIFISEGCTTAGLGGPCYLELSGAERSGPGDNSCNRSAAGFYMVTKV